MPLDMPLGVAPPKDPSFRHSKSVKKAPRGTAAAKLPDDSSISFQGGGSDEIAIARWARIKTAWG